MSNEQIGWLVRRRASVSRTQKGWSVDCTVECQGPHRHEELVADLKLLTALVEAHYPAVVVVETKPS